MSSISCLLLFMVLYSSSHGLTQKGCDVKHAYYNIVCSRFEFWCITKRNVLTYEAVCKNITLTSKSLLSLDNPEKIFDIEIYSSNIPTITTEMFVKYPNMQRLYIQTGNTKEIQGNAFKGTIKLDWLIVKNNNVSVIQPKAFSGLGKLNVLNLNLNDLTELKDYTFEGLDSLQYLSLKENKISSIQDNTFKRLKKLGVLFLNDNLLTVISDTLLVENVMLRLTWLQNNKLQTFPNNFFKNKSMFMELILDNNQLIKVNHNGFTGNISMHHNKIKELMPLGSLTTDYFDISFNNISFIPPYTFASSSNIRTLLINNNSIDAIHEDAFRNLSKLNTLRLDCNQIFLLPLGLFQDLKSLTTLNISYNQIQHIESGTFTGLTDLEILDLSNNRISVLQTIAMYPLKRLSKFYINDNSLQNLDFENLIVHVFKSLKEIDIDNNLWICEELSPNLMRLDANKIKVSHGSNMNIANINGILCDNSDFKVSKLATVAPSPPEHQDVETAKVEIYNITTEAVYPKSNEYKVVGSDKTKEALHSNSEESSSGPGKNIHILTGFGVFLFIVIVLVVIKKYFWKRKIVIRKVQSDETVSYKLELDDE